MGKLEGIPWLTEMIFAGINEKENDKGDTGKMKTERRRMAAGTAMALVGGTCW